MARRTEFGRELLSGQWAAAEFAALAQLWQAGVPVPYPVQLMGTELMLEFLGSPDGVAAPRLAQCRPDPDELADLFQQCVGAMHLLARSGCAHGDLSPYNLLVHDGRLYLIDLPQIVTSSPTLPRRLRPHWRGYPSGLDYLRRDCENICTWFTRRGLADPDVESFGGW